MCVCVWGGGGGGGGVVCFLMVHCREQRVIQHNRWLYSVKLVGYRKRKVSALWGTQKNGENKGVPHRSLYCMYNNVYVFA